MSKKLIALQTAMVARARQYCEHGLTADEALARAEHDLRDIIASVLRKSKKIIRKTGRRLSCVTVGRP